MTEQEYIEQRLDDQERWYSNKSAWNQRWYKRLRVIEIVLAAGVPFFTSLIGKDMPFMTYVVSAFAFVIAAVSGLMAMERFQENWVDYRSAAETLKREKFLFMTKSAPYDGADPFHTLVQRVEEILARENATWQGYMLQTAGQGQAPPAVGTPGKPLPPGSEKGS
ncbi:MAG TPA: DUF4231 domain-containing protein [Steroidobacteraceae bacterium]|jgi:hypothetical protein|nr:DUF4231 domain-containing protein [Steroidobacteraceae bacterium]